MPKKDALSTTLAIAGTLLIWFPVLAPIVLALAGLITDGVLRFDYLMPMELMLVVVLGGGVLVWAALRSRTQVRLIAWAFGLALGALLGTQVFAVLSGLASGEAQAAGWRLAVMILIMVVYILAVAATGVGGILLLRDLFRPGRGGTDQNPSP